MLERIKIGSVIECVGGEAVPQRMDAAASLYAGFFLAL